MIGKTFGGFRILAEIGRGGMGVVYRARQDALGRDVALKTLLPEMATNRHLLSRFRREARVAGSIVHANLIQTYEFGEADGVHYLAMELIDGESLATLLKRERRLAPKRAVEIVIEVASGLAALHDAGMVHRDVKPSNVLLAGGGNVKLTDFGIALLRETDDQTRLTETSQVMGTAEYLSPEAAQGESVDGRSDLYSLGVLTYEALSGHLPFTAETPLAVALKHINEPPPPIRRHVPDIPERLEGVVRQCLEKRPSARPPDAAELRKRLEGVRLELEFGASPTTAAERLTIPNVLATAHLAAARIEVEKGKGLPRRGVEALGRFMLKTADRLRRPFKRKVAALCAARLRYERALGGLADLKTARRELLDAAKAYEARAEEARRRSALAFDQNRTHQVELLADEERRHEAQAIELENEARGMDDDVARLQETYERAKSEHTRLAQDIEIKQARWTRRRAEKAGLRWMGSPLAVGGLTLLALAVALVLLIRWSAAAAGTGGPRDIVPQTASAQVTMPASEYLAPAGWSATKERVRIAASDGDADKEIVYYTNTVGMKFVRIPAGDFMMGSNEGDADEKPVHRVRIAEPFFLGAREVQGWPIDGIAKGNVTWVGAQEFCRSMTQKEGLVYRLPTEAEWEYACRAGSRTEFYWGDKPRTDCAWYSQTQGQLEGGNPVGRKLPNAFGLYDMSGNVWEWCSSLYKPYPCHAEDGRENPLAAGDRVMRGGDWNSTDDWIRSGARHHATPSAFTSTYGFRVVVEP